MAQMAQSAESFTFTVGKLDAGMAILLGERAHLIEFPSLLLPPGATTGSIVNIAVHRNLAEEKRRDAEFWELQNEIYETFGVDTPRAPQLELRNVTQTSVTLEWPPLHLATAKLRSLDIYRNGERLAAIPQPTTNTSTKLSGLEINTDYSFQLLLRTTAGSFQSNIIRVRTHTMADTSGISVCFGTVQDKLMLDNAKQALHEMGARWSEKIQIDTTHFVCTTPAATPSGAESSGGMSTGPGVEYQRALQLSIPVVQPHWILACHAERKMVSIAPFYLGVTPTAPISSAPFTRPQSMSQVSLPRSPTRNTTSPTAAPGPGSRTSMPAAARNAAPAPASGHRAAHPPAARADTNGTGSPDADTSTFVNQTPVQSPGPRARGAAPLGAEEDASADGQAAARARRQRNGTMNKDFKFPSPSTSPTSPRDGDDPAESAPATISVEVPPPPPVEKEKTKLDAIDGDEDIGETVDIPL